MSTPLEVKVIPNDTNSTYRHHIRELDATLVTGKRDPANKEPEPGTVSCRVITESSSPRRRHPRRSPGRPS